MKISRSQKMLSGAPELPASKSITNRLLIIRELSETPFKIENISDAADSENLLHNLVKFKNRSHDVLTLDVGPAGTNMRFLTAFLSTQHGTFLVRGTDRMHRRPVAPLVDALRQLGARITYLGKKGFPPLKIEGGMLKGNKVVMPSDVSSQFITALMLIGPVMPDGLSIALTGDKVSFSYIAMTKKLMEQCGAETEMDEKSIHITNKKYRRIKPFRVESDWSAASYWYGMLAMASHGKLMLSGLQQQSTQGDAILAKWMQDFGINTSFEGNDAVLQKQENICPEAFSEDFTLSPDLAQTMMVLTAATGVSGRFSGLKTLRIKETDRLKAMQTELKKFGVTMTVDKDTATIEPQQVAPSSTPVQTYHDHRMAMAMAMLAMKTGTVIIQDAGVVSKSYPKFWQELQKTGFVVEG